MENSEIVKETLTIKPPAPLSNAKTCEEAGAKLTYTPFKTPPQSPLPELPKKKQSWLSFLNFRWFTAPFS